MKEKELIVRDLGRLEYGLALAEQERLLGLRIADCIADHLLILEHEEVYTLGRGADSADLCGADHLLRVPVFRVSRGGGATFHGPGQLIAYPIIKLGLGERDVLGYVRRLEEVIIATCALLGAAARRQPGATGVWVDDAKLASIGVGIRRWVTWHGLAVNVRTDLSFFRAIVPCGMPALSMTSLEQLLPSPPSLQAVATVLTEKFCEVFDRRPRTRVAA